MRQKRRPATSVAPQLGQLIVSKFSARIAAPPFSSRMALRVYRAGARPAATPATYDYTPHGVPRLHMPRAGLRLIARPNPDDRKTFWPARTPRASGTARAERARGPRR